MSKTNVIDLLKQPTVELEGKYLTATTLRDGFTGTYQGDHLYLVKKDGTDYTVSPVAWDEDKKSFEVSDNPIIATQGSTVFFVVNTTNEPYINAGIREKAIADYEVLEKQVLQAFLAFIADEFSLGNYNVFLTDEPSAQ